MDNLRKRSKRERKEKDLLQTIVQHEEYNSVGSQTKYLRRRKYAAASGQVIPG